MGAVYGVPLDGTDVVEVPVELAAVFADAHHRIHGEPAGVHLGGGRIEPAPLDPGRPQLLDEAAQAIEDAEAPVVLAGPGVVLDRAVDGLRALADAASLGVLNTWGAKGVFDWRSPHHLATAGLQAWDFERGGLAGADLIVATGVDEREARAGWRLAPSVEVLPTDLSALAARITRRGRAIAVPPLRSDLARVTQAGWEASAGPLPPTKVTQHYSKVLGGRGLVAADPGESGYWVARTFATTVLGGALVTAHPDAHGFAVACAVVARRADPSRPVLAVVDEVDEHSAAALEVAASLGITVPIEVWDEAGPALDAAAHEARLVDLVRTGGQVALATDPTQLDEMLAVAGPIVAWTS